MGEDQQRARAYFDRLAPEYDRAFRKAGRGPLGSLVNRLFRTRTFLRRMELLETLFRDLPLAGKSVLDLGCGSGQVSLLAASLGARVLGIDIAPAMLAIAREAAERAGLAGDARFEEGDVVTRELLPADVVLLVGVIEYYEDYPALLARAAAAARETLVVAHTSRVAYRMLLRRILFRLQGSTVYFHPMPAVVAAAEAAGLRLRRELREHAFSILVFDRARPAGSP
jgi:2-polyprenyl-3-methyl-5-hydroxy-6-metoxy-1,4-benzoquinol methylase